MVVSTPYLGMETNDLTTPLTEKQGFDPDPEDRSPVVILDEPETDTPFDEYTKPDYHAPNKCRDPECAEIQCDKQVGAGATFEEEWAGERIWWKGCHVL